VYLVYAGLVYVGVHYTLALLLDYIVGTFLGLVLHHTFTFKLAKKINSGMIIRTIISNVAIFFINIVVLYVFVDFYEYDEYRSQIVALTIIAITSFFAYKFFIFRGWVSDK
jgi:putative flippase GtrA